MLLIVHRWSGDTNQVLKTIIDTEEVVSANDEVLYELDEKGQVNESSSMPCCNIIFRNGQSIRLQDPELLLLNRILMSKTEYNESNQVEHIYVDEESKEMAEKMTLELDEEDEDDEDD